ncbi:MAG TPA: hypothetical protein VN253_16210, partial [Kofleriaceae bacterium]|nr:hypothetical protein [Kofleriaceae bacterium]
RPAPGSSGGAAIGRDRPRPSLDLPGAPQVVSAERTSATTAGSDGDPGYTETVINGVRVRDHRKDRSAPIQLGSGRRPPDGRKIQPSLTADISNRILPIVRQCGASVPAEARGGKPRVEGEVVIAIRNQQVQITRASVRLTDVVGDFAESAKQCIDQKTLGLTVPAGDEADLEDYTITLSYGLF